ncbi:Uncharacterised protein [uncultured archaeon]|nr:Uncharacterised protein [uncultured archaeon]
MMLTSVSYKSFLVDNDHYSLLLGGKENIAETSYVVQKSDDRNEYIPSIILVATNSMFHNLF